jgi:hypothetical protein
MQKGNTLRIWLGIVALGCIWGFLESITFLGILHPHWGALFPYHLCPCFLMTAIFGSLVMGLALAIYKKPAMLIGIGLVAAAFCLLAVPFLPISVRSTTYGPVVASITACVTGSLCLAAVAGFLLKRLERSFLARIGVGALSALLASVLFILATAYGLDKPICADLGYARPLPDFLGIGGMVWMGCAAILLPLGYLAGVKLQSWLVSKVEKRPWVSYAALAAIVAFCCGLGVVGFMVGL